MKFATPWTIAAALLLPAALVCAQGASRFNESAQLLLIPAVRTELQLDPQQTQQVDQLQKTTGTRVRELLRQFVTMTPQQREEKMSQLNDDKERKLVEILNPKQRKRLYQIALQRTGARVLIRSDVAAELRVAPIQREQFSELLRQEMDKIKKLSELYRGKTTAVDQEHLRKDVERIRTATDQGLLDLLHKDQREQYKNLIGLPFKLPEPQVTAISPKSSPGPK